MRPLLILRTFAPTLILCLFVGASSVQASSYLTVSATVIDPIQSVFAGPHPYSGPNLEPFVSTPSANLSFAVLNEADLYVADLRFVNLTGSRLEGANLDFTLLIDAELGSVWLVDASLVYANLSGADLTNAVVGNADLSNANLTGANCTGVNFLLSVFLNANLTDADLRGTALTFATFEGATLTGALYDENTIFPSGNGWSSTPWNLDSANTPPWDRGMIPTPEPSIGWMLVGGAGCVAGLARRRPRKPHVAHA